MQEREEHGGDREAQGDQKIWILVDHSAREASLIPVARNLEERGFSVELVTITEVIGSVAREALAGGAERLLRGLRVATRGGSGDEDLVGAIRRRQPDMLVVTEARYARAIGVLENLTGVKSLQLGLVPDFYVDAGWFNGQLHAFVVPDESTRDEVVDRGVAPERVCVGGPALRPGFGDEVDRDAARGELGFDDDLVVVVRADGFDSGTLEKLVFQCTLSDRDARFIFHYDGDGATASTLRRAAEQYGLPAAMFGRVPDLERYLVAADGVLASPDDPYLAELLESATPSLLVGADGARRGNGEALCEQGFTAYLDDVGQLGTRLDRFLDDEELGELGSKLEEWGGQERHDQLVEAIEEVAAHADEWRRPARPSAAEADDVADEDTEEASKPSGPFEEIGSRSGSTDKDAPAERREKEPGEAARRDTSRLSQAEAKEQLAELILKEREVERRLQELEKQQERWRDRLELAREWKESDLMEEAESILRGYIDEEKPLLQNLEDIRSQKQKLKAAARPGGRGAVDEDGDGEPQGRASKMEERFQKMEVDRDLEGLKDRIRRELGE